MTYSATPSGVSTSANDWSSLLGTAINGVATVAAAKYLAQTSSGNQVAAAATTPTGSTYTGPVPAPGTLFGMPANTAALVGGVTVVALAALLILNRR